MTLDILIPHYKEPENIIKLLLDSIENQQGIDFTKIKVIIVNDGNDVILSDSFLKQYTFNLKYIIKDHEGASAARNKALEISTADYVMFCDADDMFIDCTALWQIFINLRPETTVFKSVFVAEMLNKNINFKNDDVTSVFYLMAPKSEKVIGHADTFVHGKVFKRQFLIDNDIRWPVELDYGEDSFFCKLAIILSKEVSYYDKPFYLWKYNANSITRSTKSAKTVLHDYKAILLSCKLLTQAIYKHGYTDAVNKAVLAQLYFSSIFILTLQDPELIANCLSAFYEFYQYAKQFDIENFMEEDKQLIFNAVQVELTQETGQRNQITLTEVENWLQTFKEENIEKVK